MGRDQVEQVQPDVFARRLDFTPALQREVAPEFVD